MTHEEYEAIAARDAVGAATPEEVKALRTHLESCAQCRTHLDSHGDTSLVHHRRFHVRPWWLATVAIVFLAMWGWRELGIRAARETVVSQDAEIMRLSAENARLRDRSQRLSNEIAALTSKDTRSISLAGQSVAPGASAKIFIEPARHRAVAFFYGLPANPSDKRYQLWIIRIDQPNPQNAGAFDVNGSGSASIIVENPPATTKIKTLAVTLETRGGVPRPTSTNYYLIGKP